MKKKSSGIIRNLTPSFDGVATTYILEGNYKCDLCGKQHSTIWCMKPAKDEMNIGICKTCLILALHNLNGKDTT